MQQSSDILIINVNSITNKDELVNIVTKNRCTSHQTEQELCHPTVKPVYSHISIIHYPVTMNLHNTLPVTFSRMHLKSELVSILHNGSIVQDWPRLTDFDVTMTWHNVQLVLTLKMIRNNDNIMAFIMLKSRPCLFLK